MTTKTLIDILSEFPENTEVAMANGRLLSFEFDLLEYIDMDTNSPVIAFEPAHKNFDNLTN